MTKYGEVTRMLHPLVKSFRGYVSENPQMYGKPFLAKKSKTETEDGMFIIYEVFAHDIVISQYGRRSRHSLFIIKCTYSKIINAWFFEAINCICTNNKYEKIVFETFLKCLERLKGFTDTDYIVDAKGYRFAKCTPLFKPIENKDEQFITETIGQFLLAIKGISNEWLRGAHITTLPDVIPKNCTTVVYSFVGTIAYHNANAKVSISVNYNREEETITSVCVFVPMVLYNEAKDISDRYIKKLFNVKEYTTAQYHYYPEVKLVYTAKDS